MARGAVQRKIVDAPAMHRWQRSEAYKDVVRFVGGVPNRVLDRVARTEEKITAQRAARDHDIDLCLAMQQCAQSCTQALDGSFERLERLDVRGSREIQQHRCWLFA